tara:strand:+ start:14 stop:355 length:342 start_codon:yes stop_codon:yes gene_type:complete
MSKIHQVHSVVSATGGVINSALIYPQHPADESGRYQVSITLGSITNVFFYGRLSAQHTWEQVAVSGAMTTSTGNSWEAAGEKADALTIFPQMFVQFSSPAGANPIRAEVTIME